MEVKGRECPLGKDPLTGEVYFVGACKRGCEAEDQFRYCWRLGVLRDAAEELVLMAQSADFRDKEVRDFNTNSVQWVEPTLATVALVTDPSFGPDYVQAINAIAQAAAGSRSKRLHGSPRFCRSQYEQQLSAAAPTDEEFAEIVASDTPEPVTRHVRP